MRRATDLPQRRRVDESDMSRHQLSKRRLVMILRVAPQ
jgi:hypothetical protein